MLLPETKEREYRFKLALRMGLPIFGLISALILHTLATSENALPTTFYVEATLLLLFSIYFIFYLIYHGFTIHITDPISKTFSREYLYEYLQKEIKKQSEYTLLLISIENLYDINVNYGLQNGDKVLYAVAKEIASHIKDKGMKNFPFGHIKGGDFILGFPGKKEDYNTLLELLCLKCEDFKIDNIEIHITGAVVDTTFSKNLDYLVEKLFELQESRKNLKKVPAQNEINPNELEFLVVNALKERNFVWMMQDVYADGKPTIKECFIKLQTSEGKIVHQKSYIKILNKMHLMLEFDLMVLEKLFYEYAIDKEAIYALTISPTSLRNKLFETRLRELLIQKPFLKSKIMFLLSESDYFAQIAKYRVILNNIREMGFLITIDKLGSMPSSFLYLRDLEIDGVRFDSFYTKEIKKRKYRSIIEGFNLIAHNNSIKSWMKMIEDEETMQLALAMKIDYLQGKFFCIFRK